MARSLSSFSLVIFQNVLLWVFFFFLPQFSLFRSYFAVSVVLKERRSKDSVTLAWQGPERPSGAIVEYEVIYYEKVRRKNPQTHTQMNLY